MVPRGIWHCSVPFILLTSRPLLLPVSLRLVVAFFVVFSFLWSYSLPQFCALSVKVPFRMLLNNKTSHFPEPLIIFNQNRVVLNLNTSTFLIIHKWLCLLHPDGFFFYVVARSGNSLQNSVVANLMHECFPQAHRAFLDACSETHRASHN